jgi:hypothetical protein
MTTVAHDGTAHAEEALHGTALDLVHAPGVVVEGVVKLLRMREIEGALDFCRR